MNTASVILPGLLLLSIVSSAQDSSSRNRYEVYANVPYNLYTLNVRNDDRYPNAISARNTIGYRLGVTYTRVTKSNILFAADLAYDETTHDVQFHVPTDRFDQQWQAALGPSLTFGTRSRVKQVQLALSIGYQHALDKVWNLEGRIGLAKGIRLHGEGDYEAKMVVASISDDQGNIKERKILEWSNTLKSAPSIRGLNYGNQNYEVYIGTRRKVKSFLFTSLSTGLTFSRVFFVQGPDYVLALSYIPGTPGVVSADYYKNLSTAIGLRVAAAF